jgi:ubiquinone/menaquinone biosynthesis C-methylase UbiE
MNIFEQTTPEMKLLKMQLRETWIAGDFGRIAKTTSGDAEEFIARLNLEPGTRVLDIGCGSGNLAVPAARSGAIVTGIDIAPNLLEEAGHRAAAEDLEIRFVEGDAERLPFEDNSFDVVVSMFGAMFAPRTDRAITELFRVCRAGGLIAMANWTLQGFIGQLYKIAGAYLPAPQNHLTPFLWGDMGRLAPLFGEAVTDFRCRRRETLLKFPFGAQKTVEYWSAHYGPTRRVFETIEEAQRAVLLHDMEWLFSANDVSGTDGDTLIKAEYLEVMATLRN